MISSLKKLFDGMFAGAPQASALARLEPIQLVTATLLIELTRADFESTPAEIDMAKRLLAARYGLDEQAVQALIDQATSRAEQAVSLHEFTHRLNQELTPDDKSHVIEMLWRLSFADERLDKYEEQLIRRVAGLLHVPDRELLRLRERVRAETGK
jgi:uncharacterized tellurite resistance protein B-like protein